MLAVKGWSARDLAKKAGFKTASQVSSLLRALDRDPDAVELRTLRKIASGAEISFDWLVTGLDELADAALRAPHFRDLPNWPALLEDSRAAAPNIPAWVWEFVAECRPLVDPEAVTVGDVVDIAEYVLRRRPRPA